MRMMMMMMMCSRFRDGSKRDWLNSDTITSMSVSWDLDLGHLPLGFLPHGARRCNCVSEWNEFWFEAVIKSEATVNYLMRNTLRDPRGGRWPWQTLVVVVPPQEFIRIVISLADRSSSLVFKYSNMFHHEVVMTALCWPFVRFRDSCCLGLQILKVCGINQVWLEVILVLRWSERDKKARQCCFLNLDSTGFMGHCLTWKDTHMFVDFKMQICDILHTNCTFMIF